MKIILVKFWKQFNTQQKKMENSILLPQDIDVKEKISGWKHYRHGRNKDQEDEEKAVKTSLKPRCKKKKRKQRFRRTSDIKDGGLIYKDITSMFDKEEDSNNVEYLNQAIKESHKIIPQLRKSEVKKIGELALEDSYNNSHVPIRLLHMIIDLTRAKLQTGNTESNKEKKKVNTKLACIIRYQNHGIQMLNLGSMIHKEEIKETIPLAALDKHEPMIVYKYDETIRNKIFNCRVSSGQGKVREIPDLAKVREKSGNFVERQGKN